MNYFVYLSFLVLINATVYATSNNLTNNNNETVEISQTSIEEARKKGEEKDFMSKMLPMMVIPFLVSSGMIPMSLISLKIISRNSNNGGVYNHNINEQAFTAHYGYNGGEEYGAYVNRRKKKQFL